jgi:pilus assembly protein TadC
VIRIGELIEELVEKLLPRLGHELKVAQMKDSPHDYLRKSILLAFIFALNLTLPTLFILLKYHALYLLPVVYLVYFFLTMLIALSIPKINIKKVRSEIESDIFVPAWKLLTLIEAGNSIISALINVSRSKAKSGKYFGKIASDILLGKTIEQAFDDAIKYTPSESFRKVLEPIKKSLKTGADIKSNLLSTLRELSQEKAVEIEMYEKKLSPLSMFYLIFGTILPALAIIGAALIISFVGLEVRFFPFLFLYLVLILITQVVFINIFLETRPLVKL